MECDCDHEGIFYFALNQTVEGGFSYIFHQEEGSVSQTALSAFPVSKQHPRKIYLGFLGAAHFFGDLSSPLGEGCHWAPFGVWAGI